MKTKTPTSRAFSSLAAVAAITALAGSSTGTGGCSGFATQPSSERMQVDFDMPASGVPTRESPRPITFGTPDNYVIKVSALKQDGSPDTSFNGYVRITTKPGNVTALAGPNVNGFNVLLQNGVADQVTVSLRGAFGDTRIWAEDEGYVPGDPDGAKPPECANGLDDNGNGKIDFPNDPGCYAANDDSEDGGTYAAGASPAIWYQLPRIADVRGVTEGGTSTAFPNQAVTMDTGYRGNNSWVYGSNGCTDSTCAGAVVTYVSSAGFFVTDLEDDDSVIGRGYGSVYAYNFSAPPNMRQCDRLRAFGGEASDFFGFTEINYPTWQLEEWDPTARPCLIPDPHVIAPTCALPNGQRQPNCYSIASPGDLPKVKASLVRVETANGVAAFIGAKLGPGPGCCGLDPQHPCCCGGTDPAAPACAQGDAGTAAPPLGVCTAAGQAFTATCTAATLTADNSNCDLNHDGKVDFTTGTNEGTCSTNCDNDNDCSEYSNFLSQNQFRLKLAPVDPTTGQPSGVGVTSILGDGSSDPEFNVSALRGVPVRSFTGALFFFSGGKLNFTIQARCADDIVLDLGSSPIASDTACVHARTTLDNSEGSN